MNTLALRRAARLLPATALASWAALAALAALAICLMVMTPTALAGPGAHGPNGEHLDGPAASGTASALPRLEAQTEAFELVATLQAGELSVLTDRYETNEPVLNAVLEVESGGIKAKAVFRADQGDYAINDAKLLALLRSPGEHALVFTLTAGAESDLLDGTLVTAAGAAAGSNNGHDHGQGAPGHGPESAAWAGAGVAGLALVGAIGAIGAAVIAALRWRQRRRHASKLQGAL